MHQNRETRKKIDSDFAESDLGHRQLQIGRDLLISTRETGCPVDTVQKLYRAEHDKLERSARIKTFAPLLAYRHVKAMLHVESGKRH